MYKIRSTSRPANLHSLLSNNISGSTAILWSVSRHLGRFYTNHELKLSTAVIIIIIIHEFHRDASLKTKLQGRNVCLDVCGRHVCLIEAAASNDVCYAVAPLVSLHQLYGTVCLLTLLTLHHYLLLETASKHFYFTILPLAAQPTRTTVKRLRIFGLDGAI